MTALVALWALIPTKDKLYGLLVIALCIGFGAYTRHERSIGATKLAMEQSKVVANQAARAAEKTAVGASKSTSAEVRYVSTINAAVLDSPHLLVLDSGAATTAMCAAEYPTERDVPTESSVEHPRDVGPELDKIGRDADAQVTFLQSLVKSCVDIGACKLIN